MERIYVSSLKSERGSLCFPVSPFFHMRIFSVLISSSASDVPCVCVSLSPFPSEVFGQLWLAVCIAEVVTLTSCLIPGPLGLIDGQSKHCGLLWSGCARACTVCLWLWINNPGAYRFEAVLNYRWFIRSLWCFADTRQYVTCVWLGLWFARFCVNGYSKV